MEELNELSSQLLKLKTIHDWETADETARNISNFFGIEVERFKLWRDPRIQEEAPRFMVAHEMINEPASYEAKHSSGRSIEIKLFWMKKTTKTNLSWVVGAADNFEDSNTTKHKDIGVDLVIPEACDRVYVIVSNQYKLRVLELNTSLSMTDKEILSNVIALRNSKVISAEEKTAYHNGIWEAFNFEPINKRFYKELVDRFITLRDHLVLQKNIPQAEAVSFVTRLIGRLLFVKFLDKKGLINQDVDYFGAPLGDSKVQTEYYRKKLEVLFYKTLNTEISDRGFSDIVTPYLNGGLFESSDTDFYEKGKVTFPDNYFSVFQGILIKYNFTVDESSPEFQQIAVDPEMLGRIFESLLGEMQTKAGENLRSATGAFYTPREIVSYMCEQSVIEYLKSKIEGSPDRDRRIVEIITLSESLFRDQDQNKRRDWKPYAKPILEALDNLSVLDPAVGSGAFPMGMLHLLVKIYTRLDSKYEKNLSKLKRDILSRSLYGSDISTTAIEICRLRAWLSLIVDIIPGEQVVPLPNLEFHFVCANTLISLDSQDALNDKVYLRESMRKIREEYYETNSKKLKESLRKKYETLLDPTQESLLSKNDNILKTYRPFTHESVASFFDPELMFGQEKFDIVIGNPPYGANIDNMVEVYKKSYFDVIKNYAEIYKIFFKFGIQSLKENGVEIFISPNTYLTQPRYKDLRSYLLKFNIKRIVNLGESVFDEAVVPVCVSLICNSKGVNSYIYNEASLNGKYKGIENLIDINVSLIKSLPIEDQRLVPVLNIKTGEIFADDILEIKDAGIQYHRSGIGLKNKGGNDLYERLFSDSPDKFKNSKSVWYGKLINKYYINENTDEFFNLDYKTVLREKESVSFTKEAFLQDVRILWRQTASHLVATIDTQNRLFRNTIQCGWVKESYKNKIDPYYILVFFNSSYCKYLYQKIVNETTGRAFPQVKITHLKKIPIKIPSSDIQKNISEKVKKIMELKKHNIDSFDLELEIDNSIYLIYGLTDPEIKTVKDFDK